MRFTQSFILVLALVAPAAALAGSPGRHGLRAAAREV
jgi:hypothetical protein